MWLAGRQPRARPATNLARAHGVASGGRPATNMRHAPMRPLGPCGLNALGRPPREGAGANAPRPLRVGCRVVATACLTAAPGRLPRGWGVRLTGVGRGGGVKGAGRRAQAEQLATSDEMKTLRCRALSSLNRMCQILEAEPIFVSGQALRDASRMGDRFLWSWSLLHQRSLNEGSAPQPANPDLALLASLWVFLQVGVEGPTCLHPQTLHPPRSELSTVLNLPWARRPTYRPNAMRTWILQPPHPGPRGGSKGAAWLLRPLATGLAREPPSSEFSQASARGLCACKPFLAGRWAIRGECHYNVTPKVHALWHVIDGAAVANPFKLRAYLHESFIGAIARLFQKSMQGNWKGPPSQPRGPALLGPCACLGRGGQVDSGPGWARGGRAGPVWHDGEGRVRPGQLVGARRPCPGSRPGQPVAAPGLMWGRLRHVQEVALRKYLIGLSLRAAETG